jgi:hypothetical protein
MRRIQIMAKEKLKLLNINEHLDEIDEKFEIKQD